jgi:hypothetical protein
MDTKTLKIGLAVVVVIIVVMLFSKKNKNEANEKESTNSQKNNTNTGVDTDKVTVPTDTIIDIPNWGKFMYTLGKWVDVSLLNYTVTDKSFYSQLGIVEVPVKDAGGNAFNKKFAWVNGEWLPVHKGR